MASTARAQPMPGVHLIQPPGTAEPALRTGVAGELAYRISLTMPSLYTHLRGRELLRQGRRLGDALRGTVGDVDPHLIHVLRTQPEGIAALPLRRLFPKAPFLLSTWGQDFVVWARSSRRLERATREVIGNTVHAFPDNDRDARLLTEWFDFPTGASTVMPATGGLVTDSLDSVDRALPVALPGEPSLLSMRGYENAYIRMRVLLQALRLFIRRFPRAHLYVDGPKGHPGRRAIERWAKRYGVQTHVTLVHLDRNELFDYMRATDLYVSATISDGLPMSLLEALYFGQVPVVADLESIRPPLVPGVNGVVFDTISAQSIAAAWERALPFVAARDERQRCNREQLAEKFGRTANLRRMEQVYLALARSNGADVVVQTPLSAQEPESGQRST